MDHILCAIFFMFNVPLHYSTTIMYRLFTLQQTLKISDIIDYWYKCLYLYICAVFQFRVHLYHGPHAPVSCSWKIERQMLATLVYTPHGGLFWVAFPSRASETPGPWIAT